MAREEVERRVRELLEEIGYKRSLRVIKTLGVVLTKILLRTCKGVFVNERRLLEVIIIKRVRILSNKLSSLWDKVGTCTDCQVLLNLLRLR